MSSERAIRGLAVLILPALLMGCAAQQRSFRPADTTTYERGYPATFYHVMLDSQQLGIVKIYSEGAYTNPSGKEPVIGIRLRIRNLSNGPMNLDLSRCDVDVDTDAGEQVLAQPLEASTLSPIPAGGIGRIALSYPLPGNVLPDDVESFDFDWTLDTEKGAYGNTTPFVRRMYHNVYRYYPAYDGWWDYPPGWGWGPSWGWYGPYVHEGGDEGEGGEGRHAEMGGEEGRGGGVRDGGGGERGGEEGGGEGRRGR